MPKLSNEEKKWRAQEDARTLAEAETIKQDKTRVNAAKKEAVRMAKEAEDRMKAMKKIGNVSVSRTAKKSAPKKSPAKKKQTKKK